MAFITIAGTAYDVIADDPGGEVRRQGKTEPMFDGSLRSSIRLEKEVLRFTLYEMPRATFALLRNAVAYGTHVNIGGDALPFGSFNAVVTITDFRYIRDGVSFLIRPTVEIMQV